MSLASCYGRASGFGDACGDPVTFSIQYWQSLASVEHFCDILSEILWVLFSGVVFTLAVLECSKRKASPEIVRISRCPDCLGVLAKLMKVVVKCSAKKEVVWAAGCFFVE